MLEEFINSAEKQVSGERSMSIIKLNLEPRMNLDLDVNYRQSYGRQHVKGRLKNISLSGAFLSDLTKDFKLNEKLTFEFSVGGRKRELCADVVWKNMNGCGVRFKHINKRDVQIIDDLMYFVENKKESVKNILDSIFKAAS